MAGYRHHDTPMGLDTHRVAVTDVSGASGAAGGGKAKATPKPKGRPAKQHNVVDGAYATSRGGARLCGWFNAACGCSPAVNGQWCPCDSTQIHLCALCLSPLHGKTACTRSGVTDRPSNLQDRGKGGKKGGKGGHQKGGKGAGKPAGQQRWSPY